MIKRKKKNWIAISIVTLILLISGIAILSTTLNKSNADDTRYPLCTYNNNSAHPQGMPYRTTSATYLNSNSHAFICTFCGDAAGLTGSHVDDDNNGECDLCGGSMSSGSGGGSTHTHSWSAAGTDNGDGTHRRTCTVSGCSEVYDEAHIYILGACMVCGAASPSSECPAGGNHNLGSWQPYYGSSTQHGRICSKCNRWVDVEDHYDTNPYDGYCDACGYQMSSGPTPTTTPCSHTGYTDYYSDNNGKHRMYCRDCGDYLGIENCTMNNGTCIYCGYTIGGGSSHTHIPDSTWHKNGTYHWHECTVNGCEDPIVDRAQHSGGSHSNGGTCTVCGEVYQTHSQSTTVKSYTKTSTNHTPVYECTYSGCTSTYQGTAENHTGATHANGGTCTICGEVYQTHSQSTTVKSYTKTETTHTPVYECTFSGCTETYNGTAANHTFGNWIDDGNGKHSRTCTVCGQKETEDHTYENGTCTKCGVADPNYNPTTPTPTPVNPTPTPAHTTHTWGTWTDNGDGTHSKACTECGETETEDHTYENGTCTKCGATDPNYNPTTPTPTPENPTPTPENPTPTPSHTTHDWSEWKDNGDGTHSRECTECDEKETKPHNYEDGKCTDCGATDPNANNGNDDENCTHPEDKRKWKSDENEHWQECGECGEEIPGTRGKHSYKDGKCKNCGREEKDTTSTKTMPNTGTGTMVFAIIGLMGLVTLGAIKVRKYKDIK